MDPAAELRDVIDGNAYMVLATAAADGTPWSSPVWFAHAAYREFLWVSLPGAEHSRNIATRPEIAIAVFDSSVPIGSARAVYMAARAEQLEGAEMERAIEVFSRRSVAQGSEPWAPANVMPPADFRLYRATATSHSVLGERSVRIPVSL